VLNTNKGYAQVFERIMRLWEEALRGEVVEAMWQDDLHSDPVRDPFAIHLTCVLLRNDVVFVPRVFPRPSPGRRMQHRENNKNDKNVIFTTLK